MLNSSFAFVCLFSWLSGPPGFYFESNAYLSLYPVNRIVCPKIDPNTDIIFELYTRYNRNAPNIMLLYNETSITESKIDFKRKTIIYFHGFMENGKYGSTQVIRNAYSTKDDHNFLIVNAEKLLAGPWYLTAVQNTQVIAKYTARMIDYLVDKGMDLKKVHFIGHSLGGQSAGLTAKYITSGRVARITALDPAKPLFTNVPKDRRLDSSDADFVDVIHTSNTYGLQEPLGHADFYPNDGVTTQPGCHALEIIERTSSVLEQIFCSHWRSFLFYAESVSNPKSFISTACKSWKDYKEQKCDSNDSVYMGIDTPNTARGNYYLKTNDKAPFSQD